MATVTVIPSDITKLKNDVSTLKQDVAGKASTTDVDNKLKLYLNKMIYRPSWIAEGIVGVFTP